MAKNTGHCRQLRVKHPQPVESRKADKNFDRQVDEREALLERFRNHPTQKEK